MVILTTRLRPIWRASSDFGRSWYIDVGVDYVTTLILESALRNFASDGEPDYMTTANLESVK